MSRMDKWHMALPSCIANGFFKVDDTLYSNYFIAREALMDTWGNDSA